MLRTHPISRAAIAAAALLLTASVSAFGQGNKNAGIALREIESRAEKLLKESLSLSVTKERELARTKLLEAMKLWEQIGEKEKAARAALEVGDSFKEQKSYKESLYCYRQALEVKPLAALLKASAFNSIARVYGDLYRRDLALHYYKEAMSQAQAAKDSKSQATALIRMAELYNQSGEHKQAAASIARARELYRRQSNSDAEADLLWLAGRIDLAKGQSARAGEAFQRALAIYQDRADPAGQVKALCSLTIFHLSSAQQERALERAGQSVALAEKIAGAAVTNAQKLAARELRWRAWLSHARAARAAGQTDAAIRSFERAKAHIEGLWWLTYIHTEASAVGFREDSQDLYSEMVDLLIEKGEIERAYNEVERARCRAILGRIQARQKLGQSAKLDQDEAFHKLMQSIARLRTELHFSRATPERQAKLQMELKDAERRMEEARLLAEMDRFRDRMAYFQPLYVKDLQEKIIEKGHKIVEFFLGENRSFVWVVSADGIALEILGGRREIEAAVTRYRAILASHPNDLNIERDLLKLRERAGELFSILFGRLSEKILPGDKLIIVPDGPLHYLPFETLVRNKRYLVEDHEISYVPSVGMLSLWKDLKSEAKARNKMELLAFGDPVFGPEAMDANQAGASSDNLARNLEAGRGFGLPALPKTRDEVLRIAELFPSDRRQFYLGKQSVEEAVKQKSLGDFRRLHFATHSLIDENNPSRSAIVLALDNDPGEDGYLEVSEIYDLELDSDLVVLSACQTGRGQLLSGEGILGLSRAFFYAGARAVTVSLWNVSDTSTAQLMKSFYANLASEAGNAPSLRAAKLDMLKSRSRLRHPYYWAPFVVIGRH